MFKKVVSLCLLAALVFSIGSTVAKAEEPIPKDVCADYCKSFFEDREIILEESEELDKERAYYKKMGFFTVFPFVTIMQFIDLNDLNRDNLAKRWLNLLFIFIMEAKWWVIGEQTKNKKILDKDEKEVNKRLEKLKKNEQYLKSMNCFCDEFEQENI